MTDTTEQERMDLQRAAHALDALNNPLIAEALAQWEKDITSTWQSTSLNEKPEVRESLRLMLEAGKQFRLHLQRTMERGEVIRTKGRLQQTMWDRIRANLALRKDMR